MTLKPATKFGYTIREGDILFINITLINILNSKRQFISVFTELKSSKHL